MKAWCLYYLDRYEESFAAFRETLAYAQDHPANIDAAELASATRTDVAAVLGALVNDWASSLCRGEAEAATLATIVWNAGSTFAEEQGIRDVLFAAPEILVRIARFEDAAAAYEPFARQFAAGEDADSRAPEALLDAISLRTSLGQLAEAKADIELLDSTFGADGALRRKAAEAWFAVGEELTDNGDPAVVIAHEEAYLERYAEIGGRDLALRATVRLAAAHHELATCAADATRAQRRACEEHAKQAHDCLDHAGAVVQIPEPQDARAALDGMSAVPPQRAAALQAIAALVDDAGEGEEPPEAVQAARTARTQEAAAALAQVHFLLGDEVFEAFQALVLPEFDPDDWHPPAGACAQFRSPAEDVRVCLAMEKYKLWTEKIVVPFLRDCDARIRQARRLWDSIAFLGAPAWEAAAASRIGDMYRRFAQLLDGASSIFTSGILDDPSLVDAYRRQIELLTEPLLRQALGAYAFCRRTAAREQVDADDAAHCEAALHEIDPLRFSVLAEAYAAPTLITIDYAVPDIDLGAAAAVDGPTEPLPEPVAGVGVLDGNATFRFFSAGPP
jgi:hypothetical protein